MIQLKGVISRITFQNEESGFTVLRLRDDDTQQQHICVGVMPTIECGESIIAHGQWNNDKRFGRQFAVESYELTRPTTIEGIRMLLSSGLIADIGPARAQSIIDTFGAETLDILDNDPQRLLEAPGIGKKRLKNIVTAWQRQRHIKDLMLFLQEFGITVNFIYKIYKAYAEKAKEVISSNPYQLIDDIWGVGFKKADAIAQKLGFTHDSYRRIKAGIVFVLQNASTEGHVYLPRQVLIDKTIELLGINRQQLIYSLDHVIQEKIIIEEQQRLYLPAFYTAEKTIAHLLQQRIQTKHPPGKSPQPAELERWLNQYTQKTGWQPDPRQIDAISTALSSHISLLTGGPGTGKTTTLQVIVSYFSQHHSTISLAAPTGRAAQRMGTIAGLKAQTIHRLLEFNPMRTDNPFNRNKDNPLTTDVLICDEVSMIDIFLMRSLLQAIKLSTIVVFVGDSNQLPSVGPGNILADMIAGNTIPHTILTTVFRQAAQSRIVTAAHEIIKGIIPMFLNNKADNCFFIKKEDPQECLDTIQDLVTNRLPSRYELDPIRDIQVLSPMHRGTLGTKAINQLLQQSLNGKAKSLQRGETSYSIGDKVMQIKNNYDTGVFNGDIGYISNIIDEHGLTVDFSDTSVTYQIKDFDELELAYCISIHKSQGCEFNTVIIPVMTQHYVMLQRNLIYTALTRAKNLCIFVGSPKAVFIGVRNDQALQRYSNLAQMLSRT